MQVVYLLNRTPLKLLSHRVHNLNGHLAKDVDYFEAFQNHL